jgi:hypothetical protein
MTRDEFESEYAQKSGVTVEKLHELGLYAIPCDCDDPMCRGWAMDREGREPVKVP